MTPSARYDMQPFLHLATKPSNGPPFSLPQRTNRPLPYCYIPQGSRLPYSPSAAAQAPLGDSSTPVRAPSYPSYPTSPAKLSMSRDEVEPDPPSLEEAATGETHADVGGHEGQGDAAGVGVGGEEGQGGGSGGGQPRQQGVDRSSGVRAQQASVSVRMGVAAAAGGGGGGGGGEGRGGGGRAGEAGVGAGGNAGVEREGGGGVVGRAAMDARGGDRSAARGKWTGVTTHTCAGNTMKRENFSARAGVGTGVVRLPGDVDQRGCWPQRRQAVTRPMRLRWDHAVPRMRGVHATASDSAGGGIQQGGGNHALSRNPHRHAATHVCKRNVSPQATAAITNDKAEAPSFQL